MAKTLDVYRDWLGIQEKARPLNFYQILRLKQFEDSPAKIREHYRKIKTHLQKFAGGEFAEQSQELHKELTRAVLCLTDARRKLAYDSSLGRKGDHSPKARTLEEILTAQESINPEQLAKGHKFAQAAGMDLRDALMQIKAASPDVVMSAYAETVGLPYVDAADIPIDEALVRQIPAVLARQNSCAPVMIDDNQLLMISPNLINPHVEEELRLRLGVPVRTVLCTPAGINELINKHYSRETASAELAAGGPVQPAATKADSKAAGKEAGAAKPGAAGKPAAKPFDPNSPEYKKRRRDYTILAFNFTFMVYEVAYINLTDWTWLGVFAGFLLAGGAAGYAWKNVR